MGSGDPDEIGIVGRLLAFLRYNQRDLVRDVRAVDQVANYKGA